MSPFRKREGSLGEPRATPVLQIPVRSNNNAPTNAPSIALCDDGAGRFDFVPTCDPAAERAGMRP